MRLLIGILFSIIYVFPCKSFAQQDTLWIHDKLKLDEVVISGERTPDIHTENTGIVSIIERKALDEMPATGIADVLHQISGIDIRQRGAMGVQSDLNIRGTNFDQNLILLNGMDLTDPQTGHFTLNLPLNLSDIQAIKVSKGTGSRLFGPNAIGGAVNIVTEPDDSSYAGFTMHGGSHQYYHVSANGNLSLSGMKHRISYSQSGSGGYTKNTDFRTRGLFYQGVIDILKNKLNIHFGHKDKAYGAQNFYTPEYPDQFEQVKTTMAALSMELGDEMVFYPAAYWRRHRDRFELFREDENRYSRENGYFVTGKADTAKYIPGNYQPWNYYSGHNYHLTDVYGFKLNTSLKSQFGQTSLGLGIKSENIWSNVLGEPMNDTIYHMAGDHGYFDKHYSRSILNFYLDHAVSFQGLSLSAGILSNWYNSSGLGWTFFPGINLGYQVNPSIRPYMSFNKALRLPTFTDLFYSGPSNEGNPDLKPEKANNYEGGVKFNTQKLTGHLAYFYYDMDDVIAWTRLHQHTKWKTNNLTHLHNQGIELSIIVHLDKLFGDEIFLKTLRMHYTYLDQDKLTNDSESKYALHYLKHDWGMQLSGSWKNFSLTFVSAYSDRAGSFLKYDFAQGRYTHEVAYIPAWVFDGKLRYENHAWKFYLEVVNMFDNRHYDIGNIKTPGRWYKLGLSRRLYW
jgi:vitamin B12 transporter